MQKGLLLVMGLLPAVVAGSCSCDRSQTGPGPSTPSGSRPGESLAGPLIKPVFRFAGGRTALVAHIGCGDGTKTAELADGGRFLVHGLETDAAQVERARAWLRDAGVSASGSASAEHVASYAPLPYADNLVNRLVVSDWAVCEVHGLTAGEAARVLRPGGTLLVENLTPRSLDAVLAAGLVGASPEQSDASACRFTKPWPAELDSWTHHRHEPDGNKVSRDRLAGVPDRLRWIAGPAWSRSHGLGGSMKALVSAQGRLFCVQDEAPTSVAGPPRIALVGRDAFNGLVLWKQPMDIMTLVKDRAVSTFRPATLAAAGDRVYAVLSAKGPLAALDGATGQPLRTYEQAGSPWEVIALDGRVLLACPGTVSCLDSTSGEVAWKFSVAEALGTREGGNVVDMIVGDARVFFQVQWGTLVCLDLATGRKLWHRTTADWDRKGRMRLCSYYQGRLFVGGISGGKGVHALSADDGRHLWGYDCRPLTGFTDFYLVNGLLWVHAAGPAQQAGAATEPEGTSRARGAVVRWASIGLDPAAGREIRRVEFPDHYPDTRGHHRCYMNLATERYLLLGTRNTDFVDVAAGQVIECKTFRGDCGFGILPANGLIYSPPHSCTCDSATNVRGLAAMASRPVPGPDTAESHPLVRGPAFAVELGDEPSTDDWPTYRHDFRRSGATPAAIPTGLKLLWQTSPGGRLTAPTVAAGVVCVGSPDSQQVTALDAATGQARWLFTANGPIDTPPTIWRGLCMFGSADGWVYCLRAETGQLVWRFRAAPADRRIMAFGQLESAWPVRGSILVDEGVAVVTAGRVAGLDGGVRSFGLAPASGQMLWKSSPPGADDILVRGPAAIYMRSTELDGRTGQHRRATTHEYLRARDSGLLESSWPSRGRWTNNGVTAEMMVLDGATAYAISAFAGYAKDALTRLGQSSYRLFARTGEDKDIWSVPLPLRARAMMLAGRVLFLAGVPDDLDSADIYGAIDGVKGGSLWAISAADGTRLAEFKLDSAPAFDGLAAAGGRLYLTTQDGTLLCFTGKESP